MRTAEGGVRARGKRWGWLSGVVESSNVVRVIWVYDGIVVLPWLAVCCRRERERER